MQAVNLAQKLSLFSDHWRQRLVGEINDFQVKVTKFQGDFIWHHHEHEDEFFLVVKGSFTMHYREPDGREHSVEIREGEFLVMPHGVEHKPSAAEEVHVLVIEPTATLNTGNVRNERTRPVLERI